MKDNARFLRLLVEKFGKLQETEKSMRINVSNAIKLQLGGSYSYSE